MSKKQDLGGFAPLAVSMQNGMVPYGMGRSGELTKTEQQVIAEKNKQLLVMEGAIEKAQAALAGIGMMHRTAQMEMFLTAQNVGALNVAAHGTNYQMYVEQFNHHDIQLAAQHTYAIEDAAAYSLRTEAARSLYIEDPKKRGFFSR